MAVRINSPLNEVMFGEQHGYSLEDSLGRPTSTSSCCVERQYSSAIDRVVISELWEECYPDRTSHCGRALHSCDYVKVDETVNMLLN
jgi:hypothetical protein